MKKIISIALAFCILFALSPTAFAFGPRRTVAAPSLYFDGTTAYCSATVADLNQSIVATMTLSYNGTAVASWSGSGTSVVNLDGSCSVTKGRTYTLVVSGTVNGVPFSSTPMSRTC